MIRFLWVIFANFFNILIMVPRMGYMSHHPEKYSEEQRYRYAVRVVRKIKKAGCIHTKAYGTENLPKEGGYIMFPNHQGKYDALGIMYTHEKPCTVVIDDARSHQFITKQFVDVIEGKRLKKDDMRQSVKLIVEIAKEAAAGRRFMIFPEGGYDNNHNTVMDFKAGTFKSAMKSKVPIVPVAIIDSYKAFGVNVWGRVYTQVHYLEPIPYDEYKDMQTHEIAEEVRSRIVEKIDKVLGE